jgi:hypothetical protein
MANKGTCKAANCDKDVRAKGYCNRHYAQWKRGKLGKPRYRSCNAEGCHKPMSRRGFCAEHFAANFSKKKGEATETPAA